MAYMRKRKKMKKILFGIPNYDDRDILDHFKEIQNKISKELGAKAVFEFDVISAKRQVEFTEIRDEDNEDPVDVYFDLTDMWHEFLPDWEENVVEKTSNEIFDLYIELFVNKHPLNDDSDLEIIVPCSNPVFLSKTHPNVKLVDCAYPFTNTPAAINIPSLVVIVKSKEDISRSVLESQLSILLSFLEKNLK